MVRNMCADGKLCQAVRRFRNSRSRSRSCRHRPAMGVRAIVRRGEFWARGCSAIYGFFAAHAKIAKVRPSDPKLTITIGQGRMVPADQALINSQTLLCAVNGRFSSEGVIGCQFGKMRKAAACVEDGRKVSGCKRQRFPSARKTANVVASPAPSWRQGVAGSPHVRRRANQLAQTV